MEYSFDVEIAEKYGVEEAIVIRHLKFWIEKNRATGKNLNDGRTWTYMSVDGFGKIFTFWTAKQIRRILLSLIDQKIIMTGNYNKVQYDRTIWYAFVDESIFLHPFTQTKNSIFPNKKFDFPKQENRILQKGKPIPDMYTDNTETDKYKMNRERKKFNPTMDDMSVAKAIQSFLLEDFPELVIDVQEWYDDVCAFRLSGVDHRQMIKAYKLARADEFWRTRILSIKDIRTHFNKLIILDRKKLEETGKEVEKNEVEKKPVLFRESKYFDFEKFRAALDDWEESKCRAYWQQALDWSDGVTAKGGKEQKKIDWIRTVRVWARNDVTNGGHHGTNGKSGGGGRRVGGTTIAGLPINDVDRIVKF